MAHERRSDRPFDETRVSSRAPLIAILVLSVVGVVIAGFVFFRGAKDKVAVAPTAVLPPSGQEPPSPPTPKPKPASLLKELPENVRKELVRRTAVVSDKVDSLERELVRLEAGEVADPRERLERIDKLRDAYGTVADELDEIIKDPVYDPYRLDPEYGHHFQQFANRQSFYSVRLTKLRNMSEAAAWEVKQLEQQPASKPRG
jgi:hypothetical protein